MQLHSVHMNLHLRLIRLAHLHAHLHVHLNAHLHAHLHAHLNAPACIGHSGHRHLRLAANLYCDDFEIM